jgi:hypothetical protein
VAVDHDHYLLEQIALDHPIGAAMFIPFAIARLRGDTEATEATVTVKLRDVGGIGETVRMLRLSWSAESVPARSPAVQERTVTEWAACGVACAVLSLYTELKVREVTVTGDRFDYWMDDGEREYGLEVSGTTTEDLEARHRVKVQQLLDNPYGVDGYVVVVGFTTREVILSFHSFEEAIE